MAGGPDYGRAPRISIAEKHQALYSQHLDILKDEFFTRYNSGALKPQPRDDFDLLGSLGRGNFGSTLLTRYKPSKTLYAVKRLNKTDVMKGKRLMQVFLQKQVLNAMKFPFINYLQMTFKDCSSIFLVFPFCVYGDMFIHMRKLRTLKERDTMFYGAQILLAIEFLHKLGIVYRNLKPENILLEHNGYIKLSDFRFIKFVNELRTYTLCGTPEYLAPEMILMKGYGKSIDWWTFGILLFEMIAGFTPFTADDPMKIAEKVLAGKFKFTHNFSQKSRHLIKNILQIDISKRYGNLKNSVADIKYHEFFQLIDWQAIYEQRMEAPFAPAPTHDVRHLLETPPGYADNVNSPFAETAEFEFF